MIWWFNYALCILWSCALGWWFASLRLREKNLNKWAESLQRIDTLQNKRDAHIEEQYERMQTRRLEFISLLERHAYGTLPPKKTETPPS